MKILYFGLDIVTFELLCNHKHKVIHSVAQIDDLARNTTNNIFNSVFVLFYNSICSGSKNRHRFTYYFHRLFKKFYTCQYQKYTRYIELVHKEKIDIVCTKDVDEIKRYIHENDIDLILINNWDIVDASILHAPKHRSINIHPSPLPKYRGSLPTLWALKNSDSTSAVTFMLPDAGVDTGQILHSRSFDIKSDDNAIDVENKIEAIIKEDLLDILERYCNNNIAASTQQSGPVCLTEKYHRYREINFDRETSQEILNKTKLYPYLWPRDMCYFVFSNRKIFVNDAKVSHKKIAYEFCIDKVLQLHCNTSNSTVSFRLFKDVKFTDSIFIIFNLLINYEKHRTNLNTRKS